MINVGIIGYGYWGPNLVRNFYELPESRVITVSDINPSRLELVGSRYPTITAINNYQDLIKNPKIDAVVIATPVSTHFELALAALRAGKHILIEKPITETSEQALRLIDEAARRGLTVMVDHTFIYTGAVRKMRELVANREIGDLYYFDSVRVNLGLFQHDVNVIWDLAVHDISIMDFVLSERPCSVSATGVSNIPGEPENLASLSFFYQQPIMAHIQVNWLAPVKVRRTLIGGSKKMIVYDDLEPSEKVKVYDKGIDVNSSPESVYSMLISYRTGDMCAPKLDMTEALQTEARHFVQCVENGDRPVSDGEAGLRVVRMLETATQSMKERGRPVELKYD
jgi:predicted dehydrogenase